MGTEAANDSAAQDWRLRVELDAGDVRRSLDDLVGRFRGSTIVKGVQAGMPHDIVITHDGRLLFAYAVDEATLKTARSAIESVLRRDGVQASVHVSHWDDELDDWRQTDPPAAAQAKRVEDAVHRDAEAIETRTIVASSGKLIRAEFEQSMLEWADKLGVECKVVEHPHLLTTQLGFTITGPKRKLDEFSQGLNAEERATIRTETAVMLSPL